VATSLASRGHLASTERRIVVANIHRQPLQSLIKRGSDEITELMETAGQRHWKRLRCQWMAVKALSSQQFPVIQGLSGWECWVNSWGGRDGPGRVLAQAIPRGHGLRRESALLREESSAQAVLTRLLRSFGEHASFC